MAASKEKIVIIGGGQAGLQIIDTLKRNHFAGELCLICEEPDLPYQRPPLSKRFLSGEIEAARLAFRPAGFYEDVRVLTGARVERIERGQRRLRLDNHPPLRYDGLALTTGCRVRKLTAPGAGLPGVHYLRTLQDAKKIRTALKTAQHVTIIGGGFIGLEVAAVLRGQDREVVILEARERLLPRVVAPPVADFYEKIHRSAGCAVYCRAELGEICATRGRYEVRCRNRPAFETDLIIAGIGVRPNVELAEAAGLECDNGIVIDEYARTADHRIVAAGDCTRHYNRLAGRAVRLESVQNAVDQARIAAGSLLGKEEAYVKLPWFWSDQYHLKLQIAGLSDGHTRYVLRGEPAEAGFSVFYFKDKRFIAADSINKPAEHRLLRRILEANIAVTEAQAADPGFNLEALL